jgi:hypothetical protein
LLARLWHEERSLRYSDGDNVTDDDGDREDMKSVKMSEEKSYSVYESENKSELSYTKPTDPIEDTIIDIRNESIEIIALIPVPPASPVPSKYESVPPVSPVPVPPPSPMPSKYEAIEVDFVPVPPPPPVPTVMPSSSSLSSLSSLANIPSLSLGGLKRGQDTGSNELDDLYEFEAPSEREKDSNIGALSVDTRYAIYVYIYIHIYIYIYMPYPLTLTLHICIYICLYTYIISSDGSTEGVDSITKEKGSGTTPVRDWMPQLMVSNHIYVCTYMYICMYMYTWIHIFIYIYYC